MPNPTRADFLNRSPMRSLILYYGRPRPHRHFRKSPRSARRYQDDGVYLRLGYTHDPNPLAYGQPHEHEPTPSSCCSITGAGTWVFLNDINDKISVRLYAGRGPLIGGRRRVPRKSVRPCFFDCDRAGTTSEGCAALFSGRRSHRPPPAACRLKPILFARATTMSLCRIGHTRCRNSSQKGSKGHSGRPGRLTVQLGYDKVVCGAATI
jgi:hypothetical protein